MSASNANTSGSSRDVPPSSPVQSQSSQPTIRRSSRSTAGISRLSTMDDFLVPSTPSATVPRNARHSTPADAMILSSSEDSNASAPGVMDDALDPILEFSDDDGADPPFHSGPKSDGGLPGVTLQRSSKRPRGVSSGSGRLPDHASLPSASMRQGPRENQPPALEAARSSTSTTVPETPAVVVETALVVGTGQAPPEPPAVTRPNRAVPPSLPAGQPGQPILPTHFEDPERQFDSLYRPRCHLTGELAAIQFVVDPEEFSASSLPRLTGELAARSARDEVSYFQLNVIHRAFLGPYTKYARPPVLSQSLRAEILEHVGTVSTIEGLCTQRPLSRVTPLFLGLISPAAYEVVLETFGYVLADSAIWPKPYPTFDVAFSAMDYYVESAREGTLPINRWRTVVQSLSAQIREVFSGHLTNVTTGIMSRLAFHGRVHAVDVLHLQDAVKLFPNCPEDPAVLVRAFVNHCGLCAYPDLWDEESLQDMCSHSLLRMTSLLICARTFASTASREAIIAAIMGRATSVFDEERSEVYAAPALQFIMHLSPSLLAAWFANNPYQTRYYDIDEFFTSTLGERKQFILGLYYAVFGDPEVELPDNSVLRAYIAQAGGVQQVQVTTARPFNALTVLIAPRAGIVELLGRQEVEFPQVACYDAVALSTPEKRTAMMRLLKASPALRERRHKYVRQRPAEHLARTATAFGHSRVDCVLPNVVSPVEWQRYPTLPAIEQSLRTGYASLVVVSPEPAMDVYDLDEEEDSDELLATQSTTLHMQVSTVRQHVDVSSGRGMSQTTADRPPPPPALPPSPEFSAPKRQRRDAEPEDRHTPVPVPVTTAPPPPTGRLNAALARRRVAAAPPPFVACVLPVLQKLAALPWPSVLPGVQEESARALLQRTRAPVAFGEVVAIPRGPVPGADGTQSDTFSWSNFVSIPWALYRVSSIDASGYCGSFVEEFFVVDGEAVVAWPPQLSGLPHPSQMYPVRLVLRQEVDEAYEARRAEEEVAPVPATLLTSVTHNPVYTQSKEPGTRDNTAQALTHTPRLSAQHHDRPLHQEHRGKSGYDSDESKSSASSTDKTRSLRPRSLVDAAGFKVFFTKSATGSLARDTTSFRTLVGGDSWMDVLLAETGNELNHYSVNNFYVGAARFWRESLQCLPQHTPVGGALLHPQVVLRVWFHGRDVCKELSDSVVYFNWSPYHLVTAKSPRLSHLLTVSRARALVNNELESWTDFVSALQGLEETYGFFYGTPYRMLFREIHMLVSERQLGSMLSVKYLEAWLLDILALVRRASRDPSGLISPSDTQAYPNPVSPRSFGPTEWCQLLMSEFLCRLRTFTLAFSDDFVRSLGFPITLPVTHPQNVLSRDSTVKDAGVKPKKDKKKTVQTVTPTKVHAPGSKTTAGSTSNTSAPTDHPAAPRFCAMDLCRIYKIPLSSTGQVPPQCPHPCRFVHARDAPAGTTRASVDSQLQRPLARLVEKKYLAVFSKSLAEDQRFA